MASLPKYLAAAKPVPRDARAAWYKNTAQTYAGIMLWYVFWQQISASDPPTLGGVFGAGLCVALFSLLVAALLCHFLTYLVPGLLGMQTGLPLYVVGTSTYGVRGGFIMPGFLMGALQFGWLAVNAFFASLLLCEAFEIGGVPDSEVFTVAVPGPVHGSVAIAIILAAVFMGLKGIQYVAKVATFVPLIPLVILILLLVKTVGGVAEFSPEKLTADNKIAAEKKLAALQTEAGAAQATLDAAKSDEEKDEATKNLNDVKSGIEGTETLLNTENLTFLGMMLFMSTYVVGFFATAGAAGADFGMNNRDAKDVHLGGLVGIVGATVFAGGLAMIIVAGAYGSVNADGTAMVGEELQGEMNVVNLTPVIMGATGAKWIKFLLALSAFAPACFPAFIAANSFKTTMPNVSPWISVGAGTAVSVLLAVSGWAGDVIPVFLVIGASFGPICGAMMADYLLAGRKWAGPRAGFNLAGWISWAVGFFLGSIDLLAAKVPALSGMALGIPCPPMAALIAGFVLYLILAKLGLEGKTLEKPQTAE